MAAIAAGRSLAAKAGQDFPSAPAGVVENTWHCAWGPIARLCLFAIMGFLDFTA
jgi:hypothetical protein